MANELFFMTNIKINHTLDFEIVLDNKFTGDIEKKSS